MTMEEPVVARVRAFARSLPDVREAPCWGEEGFFHEPPGRRRCLFLTVREDAAGVALSLPLPRPTFEAWFGRPPARPRRGARLAVSAARGPFAPHPLYGWRAWVVASDPRDADVEALAWAVREAYGLAVAREAP